MVLLFKQMQGSGVRPYAFVYLILIMSVENGGIRFHAHVLKMGHGSNTVVRNAMINMYARLGPIGHARKLFDGISDH